MCDLVTVHIEFGKKNIKNGNTYITIILGLYKDTGQQRI